MLRLTGMRLAPIRKKNLARELIKKLRIPEEALKSYTIRLERVVDNNFEYIIDLEVDQTYSEILLEKREGLSPVPPRVMGREAAEKKTLKKPPIIVGSSPAGLLAALHLARLGMAPLLLEEGPPWEERTECELWAAYFPRPPLDDYPGEKAIEYFLEKGAPPETGYRPGLNLEPRIWQTIAPAMVREIEKAGGGVYYQAALQDLLLEGKKVQGVRSARGTFYSSLIIIDGKMLDLKLYHLLINRGINLQSQDLALGVRLIHPQVIIDRARYGQSHDQLGLPPAGYELSLRFPGEGRNIFTYRVIPRGRVLCCPSGAGGLFISATPAASSICTGTIALSWSGGDWGQEPLAGARYLHDLEKKLLQIAGGPDKIPAQRLRDFVAGRPGPSPQRELAWAGDPRLFSYDLNRILPPDFFRLLLGAIPIFSRQLQGFNSDQALIAGPETRIKSPVVASCNISGLFFAGALAGAASNTGALARSGVATAQRISNSFKLERG